jgi:hypothetical protein
MTDKELTNLIEECMFTPRPDGPIMMYTGKGGVRDIARGLFGPKYTWRQLRKLFRYKVVVANRYWQEGRLYCGYKIQ